MGVGLAALEKWRRRRRRRLAATAETWRRAVAATAAAAARWQRGVVAKAVLAAAMFAVIPAFIYRDLAATDREREQLVLEASREHGRLLAAALAEHLRAGTAALPALNVALGLLAGDSLNLRVIFRPVAAGDDPFYYVASAPSVASGDMESERTRLQGAGILARLTESCDSDLALALRHRLESGAMQLISSVTPVWTQEGCWAVVASYTHDRFVKSSLGRAYWESPGVQIAAILYIGVALVAVAMLLRVRSGLIRFRHIAVSLGPHEGAESFAARNTTPELDAVAVEFDRIVERLAMLSFAVENSPVAVAIADAGWRIEYANPAFFRLTGYASEAAIGSTPKGLLADGATVARWNDIVEAVSRGETWRGDVEARRGDGTRYWADMAVYPLRDERSGIRRFVTIQQDASERRAILAELVAARDRAERANRSKSTFLARMSHELRTPLNAIMGFAEILSRDDLPGEMRSRQKEYARHIRDSGVHLLSVVNDLLDLAKLEAGKTELRLAPTALEPLIAAALTLVATQAESAGVQLRSQGSEGLQPILDIDERAMRQILINLLSNAIKYTPAGGAVTVWLTQDAEHIRIAVEDTGCGIPAKDLPNVTEPYVQVEETAQAREGTGLGLPIVKRLVELHGASMKIVSEVGVGTTVTLTFPCAKGSPVPA